MIVIKFGGTSVGDAEHLRTAIDIVAERQERRPIVVVSALSGVTNQLVAATQAAAEGKNNEYRAIVAQIRQRHEAIAFELVQQKSDYLESFLSQLGRQIDQISDILRGIALVGDVSLRAKDKIVAIGEKLSSVLFSYTLRLRTLPGVHVDSEEVVVTDDNFCEAAPKMAETTKAAAQVLLPEIQRGHIPVMGGFIGRSTTGATTTLGRGGSDYSAAILGAAVRAEEIQIWTDVNGMMTCDPRVVSSAQRIDLISYEEAAELAYFGAKVLHPKTITPAVDLEIPIRVLNTHNPSDAGTLITKDGAPGWKGPRAIAVKKNVSVIHMVSNQMLGAHGFLARIFQVFSDSGVSVDLVTTSEVSVTVTIDEDDRLAHVMMALEEFCSVGILRGQTIIAIVGRRLMSQPQMVARALTAVDGQAISMMSFGLSGLNLSIVLDGVDPDETVRTIHRAVFEAAS